MEVVRQIAHLEKRLLDLMTLKGQLTEERIFELRDTGESDATTDHSATEHLASSIELIRGEIAALNIKVSSLATTGKNGAGGGEEVEEEEEDKNSRHLEDAAEDASRTAATTAPSASESAPESCISTTSLSNGDKIAFASDQSIVSATPTNQNQLSTFSCSPFYGLLLVEFVEFCNSCNAHSCYLLFLLFLSFDNTLMNTFRPTYTATAPHRRYIGTG